MDASRRTIRSAPATGRPLRPGTTGSAGVGRLGQSKTTTKGNASSLPTLADAAVDEHMSRIRSMLLQPKMQPADKEALLGMVDGVGALRTQRAEAERKVAELQGQVSNMSHMQIALEEMIADLSFKLETFSKVDIVQHMMDVQGLEESISEIEATCARYSKDKTPPNNQMATFSTDPNATGKSNNNGRQSAMSNASLSLSINSDGSQDGMHVLRLIEGKFQALERLVFVLKKRVLAFESNEDLCESMDRFGSVQDMLSTSARLKQENEKLRLREMRFSRNPLLRRRICKPADDTAVFPILLMAVQNELAACYAIMDLHNMERNPASERMLKEQMVLPNAPEDFVSVDDMLARSRQLSSTKGVVVRDITGGGGEDDLGPNHPEGEYRLMQRINSLEYSNETLKGKIERLQAERRLQEHKKSVAAELEAIEAEAAEMDRLQLKEKKLSRVQRLNSALMQQIEGWESAIEAKEATLCAQNEIIEELTEQKKRLAGEVASLTKRCVVYAQDVNRAKQEARLQNDRLDGMWQFAQTLALSLIAPGDMPPHLVKGCLGFVYRDIMRARVLLTGATSRLQRVVRGHFGRKEFKRVGKPRGIPLPLPWAAATRLPPAGGGGKGGLPRTLSRRRSSLLPGSAVKGSFMHDDDLLKDLRGLLRVLLMLEPGVQRLTATPALLRHARGEASVSLKKSVSKELAKFKTFLQEASAKIMKGLHAAGVSEVNASCQVGPPLASVPHLKPMSHVDRVGAPWVGAWEQSSIYVRRHVITQVAVQTPGEEQWEEVEQPTWSKPGFAQE